MTDVLKNTLSVFKLRIGVAIMVTGLAGMAITPGVMPETWKVIVFALAILFSSASAGAFNQFIERDLDARMKRTRQRPFVTGQFQASDYWLLIILLMLLLPVIATYFTINMVAAIYVFLGAFVYGVVYTVWLKRRTWLNIVIGGLSGSFAVLAGAAVVDPGLSMPSILLAVVLFLWTPPHFWSLAFVFSKDYREAEVPMLPVVVDKDSAARIILWHTIALFVISILPVFYGMGWVYLCGAIVGGGYFLKTSFEMVQSPTIDSARKNFRASLLQLSLLLIACLLERVIS